MAATQKKKQQEAPAPQIEARIDRMVDGDYKTKAYASVTIAGAFAVHGLRVIETGKGRFISMPQESYKKNGETVYVACCGTSIQPVLQMLEQAPQLDTILLCLDNDEAGHQASRRMREQLEMRYSVERLIPENKDWNDDLTLSIENAQGFAMNEMR